MPTYRTLQSHRIFLAGASALCLCLVAAYAAEPTKHSYQPREGFVPDATTAIHVAEAVLAPIYGEEKIKSERPFIATLDNGVWTVQGTLPKGWHGGVAVAEIAKQDARVLRVSHGK